MELGRSKGACIWLSINCVCNMEHPCHAQLISIHSINCVCNMELKKTGIPENYISINCVCNMEQSRNTL